MARQPNLKIGKKDVQHVVKHLSIIRRIIGIKADQYLKLSLIIDDDELSSHSMMTRRIISSSFRHQTHKNHIAASLILTGQI